MSSERLSKSRREKIITIFIIVLLLLAAILVILDWKEIREIIYKADPQFTLVALAFTALSFITLSFSYVMVNRYFGIRLRLRDLYTIGFVTSALDNILSFMGAAGHSIRLLLLKRRGVPGGEIMAASIFHSYLNNLIVFILLPTSLLWLLVNHRVSGAGAISLGFTTGILIFFFAIASAIVILNPLRLLVLRIINRIWCFITRRDITHILTEFDGAIKRGAVAMRGYKLVLVILLLACDWAFAAVALQFCFKAFGEMLQWDVLLSGFGFGISAGNISLIPAGLGVQEASMAGIYALLGSSFAQAALVAILFRVVYDFIPFLTSLVFYRRLMRERN